MSTLDITETSCPYELEEFSRRAGWDARYDQMEPGRFFSRFGEVPQGKLHLQWEQWGRGLHITGTTPASAVGIGVVLGQGRDSWIWGAGLAPGDLAIFGPASEADYHSGGSIETVIAYLPLEEARRLGGLLSPDEPDVLCRSAVVRPAPEVGRRLIADLRGALSHERVGAIELAERESRILSAAIEALTAERAGDGQQPRDCLRLRRRHARAARAFIEENLDRPLPVEEIAAATGVGLRMLQLSFREGFRMGPLEYARTRRLNRVRRLLEGGSPETTVTAAATSHGFSHLGRFSNYYRQLFAETPSETLRRARGSRGRTRASRRSLTVGAPQRSEP